MSLLSMVQAQCLTSDDSPRSQSVLKQTMEQLINGTHTFSFDMLRLLQEDASKDSSKNGIFFSPFSIWSALAVTYMGAHSLTEQELGSILGLYGADKVAVSVAFDRLQQDIKPPTGSNGSSEFVNRLFFHRFLEVRKCMESRFANNMAYVDFSNSESARLGVNAWVEQQTGNKIKDFLPPSSVGPDTRMVVANAVYFKMDWMNQFNPTMTRPDRFTVSLTEELVVNMMRTKGNYLYGVSEALQCTALDIPYSGEDLSMVILLHQNRVFDMNSFVLQLTHERIVDLLESLFPIEVLVSMPKFKMEDSFQLASHLRKMGLKQIFSPDTADLSGFTGKRELSVTDVLHKALIDVNEQGTEAAAVTAILASRTARPAQPTSFVVNRPFIFFIRHRKTNTIYFLGLVNRPTVSNEASPDQ